MNTKELIGKMSERSGLTVAECENVLNVFLHIITKQLKQGDKVQIIGFGTFETTERRSRIGRNPKTGETLKITGKTAIKFKAGKAFKEAIQ